MVLSQSVAKPYYKEQGKLYEGQKRYELSNHLGNVLAVINDRKTMTTRGLFYTYDATVISAQDYFPFGLEMGSERQVSNTEDGYRYGFNGKEKDADGEFGSNTTYDYGFRIYNPAIGRWLSTDPINKAYESPYMSFSNSPLFIVDPDGRDTFKINSNQELTRIEGGTDALFISVNTGIKVTSLIEAGMQIINEDGHFTPDKYEVGDDGNLYSFQEFDIEGVRDLIGTTIGESSNDLGEAQGIASAMLNNIEGTTGDRHNVTSKNIDGLPVMYARNPPKAKSVAEQAQIDARPYIKVQSYSNELLFDINNRSNSYRLRVEGALRAIQIGDNTNGATHWEGTSLLRGANHFHLRNERRGALTRLEALGATTFFRETGTIHLN